MDDLKFCIDILPKVSRTFALSIEALSEPLREVVRASYLLCRIVDTIEDDEDLPDARRQELFDVFVGLMEDDDVDPAVLEAAFADDATRSPDHALCADCGAPFRRFRGLPTPLKEAARPPIIEMAVGMAEYAGRWQGTGGLTVLADEEDLARYCYFVAGTVGNLLTAVFLAVEGDRISPRRQAELQQRSVAFGLGLQMTNIVKDVAADRDRGCCFLPGTVCAKHGVEPSQIVDPAHRDAAMAVVGEVAHALEAGFEHGLNHGMLCPSHVLLNKQDQVKVLGFGLGALAPPAGWPERFPPAALPYQPPERLADGGGVEFATDVYSLGGIFIYLLTGRAPFEGKDYGEVREKILDADNWVSAERRMPQVRQAVCRFIDRCTAAKAAARYSTPEVLLAELARISLRR